MSNQDGPRKPPYESLRDATDDLGDLLGNVDWRLPLDDAQARDIRACVSYVAETIADNPHPIAEQLALASACDALLDWVAAPQDHDLVERAHKALRTYWQLCAELDEALPQQIGSIRPDTLCCPSCKSRRTSIEEVLPDRYQVTLEHEAGCLWVHRRLVNPQAN